MDVITEREQGPLAAPTEGAIILSRTRFTRSATRTAIYIGAKAPMKTAVVVAVDPMAQAPVELEFVTEEGAGPEHPPQFTLVQMLPGTSVFAGHGLLRVVAREGPSNVFGTVEVLLVT